MEIDPVCGMEVNPKTAVYKSDYQGKKYYFCSPGCKKDFDKDPGAYANTEMQAPHLGAEHKHSA